MFFTKPGDRSSLKLYPIYAQWKVHIVIYTNVDRNKPSCGTGKQQQTSNCWTTTCDQVISLPPAIILLTNKRTWSVVYADGYSVVYSLQACTHHVLCVVIQQLIPCAFQLLLDCCRFLGHCTSFPQEWVVPCCLRYKRGSFWLPLHWYSLCHLGKISCTYRCILLLLVIQKSWKSEHNETVRLDGPTC